MTASELDMVERLCAETSSMLKDGEADRALHMISNILLCLAQFEKSARLEEAAGLIARLSEKIKPFAGVLKPIVRGAFK